jgi:ubiquinone/menaquinone biosynthesis C-methylase UbiE
MADNSYSRFSRVAQDYLRYRPRYPHVVIELLQKECGLRREHIVADVGSGTGILTELFLQNGNRVYGVEPNDEMRAAAEQLLGGYPLFTSVAATAEATSLPDHSMDMITVAQAFHWFKHDLARQEFMRVLKPNGWVVLVWNLELNDGSPFANAYEALWHTYLRPETSFRHDRQRPEYINTFFGSVPLKELNLDNYLTCDYAGLKGRVLSSSYSPRPDDPRYPALLADLERMFAQHNVDGQVTLVYDTRIICGQLGE